VDPGSGSLDYLVGLAEAKGGPRNVKQVLSELRPDEDRGDSIVMVRQRDKVIKCDIGGCSAIFAENKELNRHKKVAHAKGVAIACGFVCGVGGCNRSYRTEGWLARHMVKVHGVITL
jgi:hypothetical protein